MQKVTISPTQVSIGNAFKYGNVWTKLSIGFFGIGNLVNKQIMRFILLFGAELAYFFFMINFGFSAIAGLKNLGTQAQKEIFNEKTQVYEYVTGDNSMLFLLYGVIVLFVTAGFIMFMLTSIKSAYAAQLDKEKGHKPSTFVNDIRDLFDKNMHKTLLTLPILGVVMFTIIPLVFMIAIAFTSYDHNHQPPGNLFTWVGTDNFESMFAFGGKLSKTFWTVLAWTLIWAVIATGTNYILGMLLAIVINRKETKIKGFWRFMFVLSIAVPSFVSLLTMRTIFATNGAMNILLRDLGIIEATASIPFFADPLLAKITIIVVNIWIGVPYTLLSTTGILQNIPAELYESARIDGAGPFSIFTKITLPYMLFVTTPALIVQFVGNINNFNVIYLLTGGAPDTLDFYYAGHTDLLVTWLYKLTITNKDYNLGSVVGIIVFVLMAIFSLLAYRTTGSYKNEEEFQK